MRLGTKTRDAKTIAETLATLGASVNFAIGDRYAYARFTTLSENLDTVMDADGGHAVQPDFPARTNWTSGRTSN